MAKLEARQREPAFSFSSHRGFVVGAVVTGLAVALGAFGAHGLKTFTDHDGLAIWETAVRYQAYHGLALLILSLVRQRYSARDFRTIGLCFLIGTVIFSGSLYLLVLFEIKGFGAITPIGGALFLVGWIIMAISYKRSEESPFPAPESASTEISKIQ